MARKQSAELERKKFFSDPILVSMIVVLLVFLALFILYPLLMLLVDSFYSEGKITLEVFGRVLSLERFQKAFKNTLVLGMITGIASTAIGLLFAYVEVYVKLKTKVLEKLFAMVSMLPVVSPPFVLSLSMIMPPWKRRPGTWELPGGRCLPALHFPFFFPDWAMHSW